jgi:hypothetical protein
MGMFPEKQYPKFDLISRGLVVYFIPVHTIVFLA